VVDIHAASVSGADWKTRSGYHAPTKRFPHIPGQAAWRMIKTMRPQK